MPTINLNDATPAAPSGQANVKWQADSSSPRNVSANAPNIGGVDPRTTTTETIALASQGKLVTFSNVGAIAVTLDNAAGAGFFCAVENLGAGTATLTPSSGTINGAANLALTTGSGAWLFFDGANWQAVAGSAFTAGGDLSGSSSSQEVIGIQSKPIDGGPTDGDALQYSANSGKWEPTALALKARNIGTTAPLEGGGDLSADRTLTIDTFTGANGGPGAKGAVPAPAAGDAAAGKFLKADGSWALPATSSAPFSGRKGDGSTGYIRSASTYAYGGAAVSLHFWFKPNAVPASPGANTWQSEWGIFASSNDYPLCFVWDGGSSGQPTFKACLYVEHYSSGLGYANILQIPSGDWAAMVGVWNSIIIVSADGLNFTLYLNGVSVATGTASGTTVSRTIYFDALHDAICSLFSPHAVAESAMWSAALSSGEIANLASGAPASIIQPSNLQIYWKFSGISPETDLSGNGRSGTVTDTTIVSGPPGTAAVGPAGPISSASANQVLAGPTTGAAATATFRALVGADLPNPAASSLGGVESLDVASHKWINKISTLGVPSATQPAVADLSDTPSANQVLAGPTSGAAATATFRALVGADLPNPAASSLGGVESLDVASHKWINKISTLGVPSATQPAVADLSDTPSANQVLAGPTSGAAAIATFRALVQADIPNLDNISDGTKYLRDAQYSDLLVGVPNGNFLAGTAGWVSSGTATLAQDTFSPFTNGKSLKITTASQYGGATTARFYKVSPGDLINFSAWTLSDGVFFIYGSIVCYDGAGNTVSTNQIYGYTYTSWTYLSLSFTVPAQTSHVILLFKRADAGGGSQSAWVTGVTMYKQQGSVGGIAMSTTTPTAISNYFNGGIFVVRDTTNTGIALVIVDGSTVVVSAVVAGTTTFAATASPTATQIGLTVSGNLLLAKGGSSRSGAVVNCTAVIVN